MPAVEFNQIVKKFGALTVIENLDLSIEDGEFVVLLGPSGCGKTTLLNILAGLMPVNDGQILIGDRDVTHLDPKDRSLAMVFQSYALYPTKTVRGNLAFGLSARRISAAEIANRIAWAASLLQIEHLLDRRPAQLSGGQRQRVAIGRALVKQVGLCLFDEPLSNLDAKLRTEMRMEIKRLHSKLRNTVVYVTHDQVEAMTMATKIAVMNKGVIQQVGSPADIYERPATVFVADFVGSPAMTRLDCVLRLQDGRLTAVDEANEIALDLSHYAFERAATEGQPVQVGFRAEHIVTDTRAAEAGPSLRIERPVDYFETSGADAYAFLALPTRTVPVRIDGHHAERYRGRPTLPVLLPLDRLNVFDAATGTRL